MISAYRIDRKAAERVRHREDDGFIVDRQRQHVRIPEKARANPFFQHRQVGIVARANQRQVEILCDGFRKVALRHQAKARQNLDEAFGGFGAQAQRAVERAGVEPAGPDQGVSQIAFDAFDGLRAALRGLRLHSNPLRVHQSNCSGP